jgi:hypothetical protein
VLRKILERGLDGPISVYRILYSTELCHCIGFGEDGKVKLSLA